jgi:halimadienyl-diphosphate synthase
MRWTTDEALALDTEIRALLARLGEGRVDSVAYDTAWMARLAPVYPQYGFEQALEWLREHQYEDGAWGAPITHYHDRFISTLAAIIAFREVSKDPRDERRVKRGGDALWRIVGRLGQDDCDTVGFPLLSLSLAKEATALGLDVPLPPIRFAGPYQKRIKALLNQPIHTWRANPLIFNLEGLRSAICDSAVLLEANHSIAISPAATAAYLLAYRNDHALGYLTSLLCADGTGAAPAFATIDTYEIVWSMIHLVEAEAVEPEEPAVRRLLDFLWKHWSPEFGISYSTNFAAPDVDDTASCYTLLRWGGYDVRADAFNCYELDDHFCCYPGETHPSPSTHVRLLKTLRTCVDHPRRDEWIEKTVGALYRFDENGSFWTDKWHSSPYYVNSTAIIALQGVADSLAQSRLRWILKTQNDDGGWGHSGVSTPEETACCLEALLQWDRTVERLESAVLYEAASYLRGHLNDASYTPLWISKCLYTPPHIVKATIISALYSYAKREL